MSGINALLSLDTGALDAKVSAAGGAQSASLSISIADPLDLLGEAGTLIRGISDIAQGGGDLPGTLREAFSALEDLAPVGDLGVLGDVVEILNEIKARLGPLKDLMDLDPAAMVQQALQGGPGGPGAVLERITSELTDAIAGELPDAIAIPVAALRDLASGAPGNPADVAAFFARFILGLDLAALRRPFELLDLVRTQVTGGTDVAALEARIRALTLRVDLACEALVGRAPDMAAILAELAEVRTEINLLTSTVLPDALDRFTGDIGSVDVGSLAGQLDGALAPLVARVPVPPRGLADFFLPPLRMLADGLDEIEASAITDILAEVEADVHVMFANSGITNIRDDARTLLSGVVAFLNGLPLPELRDQLSQALLGIEEKVSEIGSFSPVGDIAAKMQELADAIDGIDTSAVTDRIKGLADEVRGFTENFPIEDIKTELEALLGTAVDLVAELPPLIDDLKAQIDTLANELTTIDLSAAGDASAEQIRALRAKVTEALDSADLPDALKTPLGLLAGEVRKIDLTASLDAPLTELVAKIDIAKALAPVQAAIDQARAALQKLSPTALIAELDKPFEALLAKLEAVSPTAVVGQLSAGFQSAIGEIDKLDPVVLVQPLQDEFDAILAKARQAVDPAPLLAPLAAVYAEIQEILDLISPTRLLGRVIGEASKLPGAMADATTSALSGKVGSAPELPAATAAPIRFGDMVRPFAALVNEARAVVRDGAQDVLEEGLALISQPLALLARAGQVAGGHVSEIASAIEARRGLVDPTADSGPLAELRYALDRLARLEAGLAAGGRSSVALGGAVGSIQLDVFVTTSFPAREQLGQATDKLNGGLRTDDIGRSLHALGQVLSDFVPSALALPNTEATILARIDALFDAIDPTPIADEMDQIGIALQAKLESFGREIAVGLFKIWNSIFEELEPLLPQGLLPVLEEVLDAIRAQLSALDPATLAAELGEVLDAVFASLQAYSPAAFAGTLTTSFEAVKAKLGELDPAALLGDLDPLAAVFDELKALKPSVVLAPLTAQAEQIDAALIKLLDFNPAAIITAAIENLKLQLELILQGIEEELDGLLGDLEGGGGGSASVSVSASVSI